MKIDRVIIKNFKSLKNIKIELSNLTLITGVNSSGKSSFIQSILLFKQNQEKFYSLRGSKITNINDKYVRLGNKRDILFEEEISSENIKIEISNNQITHNLKFNTDNLKIENIEILTEDNKKLFNIFYDDFQYIMTDRIAPNISYGMSDEEVDKNLIGIKGEYTAHYLANNRHKSILEELRHKRSKTNQLLENISLWLSEISSNIEVKAKVYDELQQVNLTYSYTYGEKTTNEFTPLNIGFGVTYVLPIIVAILKAKKGDLLIIENPESHLHPAGQSKVSELCAIASANGVQIIVETHSDHFLNGIRVATIKFLLTP
jgi:predicted ATPase